MSRGVIGEHIAQYIDGLLGPEDEAEALIGARTAPLPGAGMRIGRDQARLFTLLTRLLGVRHALEIGTFTGSSALAIARGLPEGGRLVCCDVDADTTAIAREAWARAGVAHLVDLRLGPALETLDALLANGGQESFDLCFIDADKERYADYFESCLALLRPGGVVLLDNTLWSGRVVGPEREGLTAVLHEQNLRIASDARVEAVLLTVGDGVTLCRKR